MSSIRKAATSVEEVDAVVKRRRLDTKADVVVDTTPRISNLLFSEWLVRLRESCKRPDRDVRAQARAIELNENVKTYANALVVDDILIPEHYVPYLFSLSGIDELAKLFVRCDGQYYHDCSIARPTGKTILVKQGVINCSHLMHDQFGTSGQKWSALAVYQLKQLTQARHEARGKAVNAAAVDLHINGLTPDIVNIVQSFFPNGFVGLRLDDAENWESYPTQSDPFLANRIVVDPKTRKSARVRARIPWIWNHADTFIFGLDHDVDKKDYSYPPTPETPEPEPEEFDHTTPSYAPTSPPSSPSSSLNHNVNSWESTTIMFEPMTDAPAL